MSTCHGFQWVVLTVKGYLAVTTACHWPYFDQYYQVQQLSGPGSNLNDIHSGIQCISIYLSWWYAFLNRGAFGDVQDEHNFFHLEPLDIEDSSVSIYEKASRGIHVSVWKGASLLFTIFARQMHGLRGIILPLFLISGALRNLYKLKIKCHTFCACMCLRGREFWILKLNIIVIILGRGVRAVAFGRQSLCLHCN